MPDTLEGWLAHCERLHPTTIDLTLDRVRAVSERMGLAFKSPVITVGGTNGKGSTCALLESIASSAGFKVGVYTSPHLLHFTERCRIEQQQVQGEALLPHFERVEQARAGAALTYFEFTTLAILSLLAATPLDLVVLEVGLGGRLDAVNVVDADCAIITSVDVDHVEYLGPDRESIGFEKAGIARTGRALVVSDPVPPQRLLDHAASIGADVWRLGRDFHFAGDRQQWNWAGRAKRYSGLAYPALRGANQLLNAAGVLAAFEALRDRLPIDAQSVRMGLARVELPGRFQTVPGQPTLVLDVAHNPHAAATLAQNLDQMGFFPRTFAVFGAMHDKDIPGVMRPLAPLVDHWLFCDLPTPRAASARQLQDAYADLDVKGPGTGVQTSTHEGPVAALSHALAMADPADRIVVFGSFFTVGGVLGEGLPRLMAQHLH